MEIRFVEPTEVEQLRRNVQTAFPSKTPQALLDNMPGELVRPEEGRYLGCFDDDGTMIGSLLMMDFEMNVRGKMMKMGAPAYVSTNFLHKKEHIARNLLRVQMGVFAQTGTAIGACLLYTSYNQLLRIQEELGELASFRNPFAVDDGQEKSS